MGTSTQANTGSVLGRGASSNRQTQTDEHLIIAKDKDRCALTDRGIRQMGDKETGRNRQAIKVERERRPWTGRAAARQAGMRAPAANVRVDYFYHCGNPGGLWWDFKGQLRGSGGV